MDKARDFGHSIIYEITNLVQRMLQSDSSSFKLPNGDRYDGPPRPNSPTSDADHQPLASGADHQPLASGADHRAAASEAPQSADDSSKKILSETFPDGRDSSYSTCVSQSSTSVSPASSCVSPSSTSGALAQMRFPKDQFNDLLAIFDLAKTSRVPGQLLLSVFPADFTRVYVRGHSLVRSFCIHVTHYDRPPPSQATRIGFWRVSIAASSRSNCAVLRLR